LARLLFEFLFALVTEKMWRLCVLDVGLDHANVIGNVTVRRKNIKHSIKIVIEKKDANVNDCADIFPIPDLGASSVKRPGTIIGIKGHAFVGEIPNHDALPSGSVIIAGVDPHPGTRCAGFAEGHACSDRLIREGSFPVVLVEFIWLRVVGDEEIQPAVAVVIEQRDAERFAGGIVKSRTLRDVFKVPFPLL